MMVYRGYRGVKTAAGATFVPCMKSAGIFPSTAAAMVAIDNAILSRCVASVATSAPGAAKSGMRSGLTRVVGNKGPERRVFGIVQNRPGRGESVRTAPAEKEGIKGNAVVSKPVLDAMIATAVLFLFGFVALVAAGVVHS